MHEVLHQFSPETGAWFSDSVGTPTAVQVEGWPAIASGAHTLISAPTGTGKTLAAFLVFVDRLNELAQRGELEQKLYVLYISPLKALGNDIRENLKRPIEGIPSPDIRVGIRTGDTEAAERRQMIKHPPHILITTPESLYLLLTAKSGREILRGAQTVILDELHAMIDSKRGAHLMLSLARLDDLCGRKVQRIALSATIHPLDGAAKYLGGTDPVTIVAPKIEKSSDIQVNSAVPDMRVLPNGTIWPEIAQAVVDHCQRARTVLAFVEGRAQAEKLAFGINAIAGSGFARTHHGCVSKEQRHEAERQLKSGQLRVLVATSSMELGIDVGEIDLVLQVGCPLTVSGALQRLGRAGHNPGRTSVMHIFPRMVSEFVSCGMTAKVALEGGIERAKPPENCLDIVAQHVVSMASLGIYSVDELLGIITSAHSFRGVTREDLEGVLRMLAGDYEHAMDHPARPRVLYDRLNGTVMGDNYSRMLAVSSGGTIPDRGWYAVTLEDGTRLGELDEEYVFEARVGDKFQLGAFAWRMLEIQKDRVIVAPASPEGAQTPFWKGDGRGRAYEVGVRFGEYLRGLNEASESGRLFKQLMELNMDETSAQNALRHVTRQIEITGCLPDDKTIIVEHFVDEASKHQMMIHSIFGQRVNLGLEMLIQYTAQKITGLDVQSYNESDGLLLYVMGTRDLPEGLLQQIDPDRAVPLITAMLPSTPFFTMLFRYNAFRAMMMGVRRGGRVPLWVQRMRGAEVLSDAAGQMDHPLMVETMRECMEDYLDLEALETVLRGIQSGAIAVHELHVNEPSPMALPLRRQVEATLMYEYTPTPTTAFKATQAALEAQEMIAPGQAQLDGQNERRVQPDDAERLHSLLMAEGDMIAGEIDAPLEWLEALSAQSRALYIDPGLWICAEQSEQYEAALTGCDAEALKRVVRRCLRYRGAQTIDSLIERYQLPEASIVNALDALIGEAAVVPHDNQYYHAELYRRAQRETVATLRREVKTLPPENYAALLANGARFTGAPSEQLKQAISSLADSPYPAEAWENVLLPIRVGGYRPRMLDELLSQGEFFWRMQTDERPQISFHRYEDIDWNADTTWNDQEQTEEEIIILRALKQRGASFAHALAPLLGGKSALDTLMSLTEKGLVRADSFIPIRQWMEYKSGKPVSAKRRSRSRVSAQDAGRWELVRPLCPLPMEEKLNRTFDRQLLLCRETADNIRWGEALELLRVWEYTGRARRGYFIRGLSGAQFIRKDDYDRAMAMLENPNREIVWLNATDPAQAWGKVFAHEEERQFICVQGTVVALAGGRPVAVIERGGEALRVFDASLVEPVLAAFARAFELKRVYPNLSKITLKAYPDEAREAMERAGLVREMRDYVLWRKLL